MFADLTVQFDHWYFWLPTILLSGIIGFLLGRRTHPEEKHFLARKTRQIRKPRTHVFPAPPMPASEAALQSKPDPFEKGSFGERRVALRRSGSMIKVALADERLESFVPGWVVDRSMGGLGVLVEKPLEAGLLLHVRPWDSGAMAPWVQVTVRSCQPEDDRFKAGCQFVKTPPWSVMLLFG